MRSSGDETGKKVRVKCNEDDTIGDLKKLVAAQMGTRADKYESEVRRNLETDRGSERTIGDSTVEVLLPRKIGIVGARREVAKVAARVVVSSISASKAPWVSHNSSRDGTSGFKLPL
ncbi:hypothetical protein F511_25417 [Dorcoceras hygrometricum]|uniref:Ubiquitin-like domain-containing protein n=1 Tax=Dorcoceras hygrometricum TaxID=472368 RepID=A0A2Z7BVN8_9LAMI|nr:hypothetical protein F511_25417 [Dorcoceras hygrometricum]